MSKDNIIISENEYESALIELENVFDCVPGTQKADQAKILMKLISKYEEIHYSIITKKGQIIYSVKVVIEKTTNGFSVYVPELLGCITYGDTFGEVKDNIRGAIDLHIEGMKKDGEDIPLNLQGEYNIEYLKE